MKYYNRKVHLLGKVFDSQKEANRYLQLLKLQSEGKVEKIKLQEKFEILPKLTKVVAVQMKTKVKVVERTDEMAVHYHADFFYHDLTTDQWVIEDVKSHVTAQIRDYPLRRKLIKLMVAKKNEEHGREMFVFREVI